MNGSKQTWGNRQS